jgi:arylsulfatase A
MKAQALAIALLALFAWGKSEAAALLRKPNLLYMLCDDLGYGDVRALNPQHGKIATPNIDRLASQGMVFTDAHGGSSVCTPTRYGVLTGRYAWRTHLQKGVLEGFSPPLIAPERLTVAELLRQQGYHTACMGKWHLGMHWTGRGTNVDYTQRLRGGPLDCGFDSFFGISASLDMPPFIWIQGDRTVGAATVTKKWVRPGPAALDFEAREVLPTLARKAAEYIHQQAAVNDGKPFFLYLALTSPHTPIVPTKAWQGKSGLNAYGDFVMETDWAVGEVLEALADTGVADDTLVIFTSDNGCSPQAGVAELERLGHFPSAEFRGYKSDIWEGGHRIPFIVRWPGKVKAGSQNRALVCLTDLMATAADLTGAALPGAAGVDSFSLLPELLGTGKTARGALVNHSINGRFAMRQGPWKLEFCPGSGGWGKPVDAEAAREHLPAVQLYNLDQDVGERTNLEAAQSREVQRLTQELEKVVAQGRSTPGAQQTNDVPVDIRKAGPKTGKLKRGKRATQS